VRVQANNTPRNLSTGDRVTVSGYASNGVFIGENVRVVRDDRNDDRNDRDTWFGRDRDRDDDDYGDDWSRTNRSTDTTVYGVVTRDLGGNTFEVRTDDGRLVTVRARNGEPNRLTRGDRVVAQGRFNPERNVFVAETVRITRNDDAGRVNFPGTVTSIGTRNRLSVRGDNGRTYIVNTRHAVSTDLRRGDRVRVVGDARNGVVTGAQVQEISRNTNGDDAGRVSFLATVTSIGTRNRLSVRGDNGRTYIVNTRHAVSTDLRKGDRVRVVGDARNGVVTAAQVQEISRNTNDRNGRDNDRRIEFTGTVVVAGWMGQQLTIRRDDGKQFSITAPRDSGSFRNGDRVRVVGWKLDGGRVQATSITRL